MSNIPNIEQTTLRDLFGIIPIDPSGTVGGHVGIWHHTLAEAEHHLTRVREIYGKNYIVLSSAEHDTKIREQQASGRAFKTGHDFLMDEFDTWLKDNHLVRGSEAAAKIGLSEKEFKSVTKRGFIKRQHMPDHDNLIGFPADLSLTKEQRQQVTNEYTLNAQQVAEKLGISLKEFVQVKRQADIAHSAEILGRTVPSDSGTAYIYSRADIEKLRSATEEVKAKRPPTSGNDVGRR